MRQQYDFFDLRFPPQVANVCHFFHRRDGEFFDLPFIIPYDCKTVNYENADTIIYGKSKYLKLTERSQIVIKKLPSKTKKFYWGVVNVSSENKIIFLIWVNMLTKDEKDIMKYFYDKKNFCLRIGANERFTILWSP